jgi:hypothetical protein
MTRGGPIPASPADREAYLATAHPGYASLAWLERRHGPRYVAYAAHLEHLHAFASGRLLGNWTGPWSFERVQPLRADVAALHRDLRAIGAGYLLLPRGSGHLRRPEGVGRFALVHADADADVWSVLDRPPPPQP